MGKTLVLLRGAPCVHIMLYLFNQKDAENWKLQYYVKELEMANEKIEQLALKNERQRMARDFIILTTELEESKVSEKRLADYEKETKMRI